jgi:hypothetical protein
MSDALVQEMLQRVKTAITKLGFLHLLLETEPVSEVLFKKKLKTADNLKHTRHIYWDRRSI